ncbi:MAG: tRNA (adenosine(37)-N6)-threonylcarbamoyltransferase complex dimerization subunit type 1 TsaB [Anaerolineae bacterium]|nr:tRNA (adenosine(37)-N6)-threonylcarbamoyltransferase complex dimerization subunit type 1 TsaB [Anaerolineae bacterium]
MLLAIDTATSWTGLALHDGEAVLVEWGWRARNTQTVALAPAIQQMLSQAAATPADLQAVAVALGPGSYTGLRVGMGLAKGIALANQVPLVGIPTLAILAAAFGELPGRLLLVAEAGRTRISAALYQWQKRHGWQNRQQPFNTTWDELLTQLAAQADSPIYFAGEIEPGAAKIIRNRSRQFHLVAAASHPRRAGYLAELGWQRLRKNQPDDPASLIPLYLRDV